LAHEVNFVHSFVCFIFSIDGDILFLGSHRREKAIDLKCGFQIIKGMRQHHPTLTQTGHKPATSADLAEPVQFAQKVIEARRLLNWTQEDLADKADVSKNTVGNIERALTDNLRTRGKIEDAINEGHLAKFGTTFKWTADDASPIGDRLDGRTLSAFISQSELVNRIDRAIGRAVDMEALPELSFVHVYLERTLNIGITSVSELQNHIEQRERMLVKFVICCFEDREIRPQILVKGMGIAALHVILFLERKDTKGLHVFLKEHALDKTANLPRRVERVQGAYKKAQRLVKGAQAPR
jgi:DNA-binding XRE family transcriptional regulator